MVKGIDVKQLILLAENIVIQVSNQDSHGIQQCVAELQAFLETVPTEYRKDHHGLQSA